MGDEIIVEDDRLDDAGNTVKYIKIGGPRQYLPEFQKTGQTQQPFDIDWEVSFKNISHDIASAATMKHAVTWARTALEHIYIKLKIRGLVDNKTLATMQQHIDGRFSDEHTIDYVHELPSLNIQPISPDHYNEHLNKLTQNTSALIHSITAHIVAEYETNRIVNGTLSMTVAKLMRAALNNQLINTTSNENMREDMSFYLYYISRTIQAHQNLHVTKHLEYVIEKFKTIELPNTLIEHITDLHTALPEDEVHADTRSLEKMRLTYCEDMLTILTNRFSPHDSEEFHQTLLQSVDAATTPQQSIPQETSEQILRQIHDLNKGDLYTLDPEQLSLMSDMLARYALTTQLPTRTICEG